MRTRRSLLIGLGAACASGGSRPANAAGRTVLTGIDVLAQDRIAPFAGLRVGLITNQTGRDAEGRRTIDILRAATNLQLAAIFSPEHGLQGDREGRIASGIDIASGLPVQSLYGPTRRPSAGMLHGLDALVVDLQDVGVRFYTYATTMAYAMEAAAPLGLRVVVLDRPNPIAPAGVRGPVLDPAQRSFTGYFPAPVQHGMTLGELAAMFNAENRIGAKLTVVPMQGWRRGLWYDETGLPWIPPSPNLRTLTEAILYPGVGLIEGAEVSVGRGTATPFELVGAPWIEGPSLAEALEDRAIPGVLIAPARFTPAADRYQGQTCLGARISLADRSALDAPRLGVELAAALRRLDPQRFALEGLLGNIGSVPTLQALAAGEDPADIVAGWSLGLQRFEQVRARYLLYG